MGGAEVNYVFEGGCVGEGQCVEGDGDPLVAGLEEGTEVLGEVGCDELVCCLGDVVYGCGVESTVG